MFSIRNNSIDGNWIGRDLEVLAVDGRDLEELEGRADRTALIPLPLPFGPAVAGRLLLLSGERN